MRVSMSKSIFTALQLMLLCLTGPDQAAVMEKLHWSRKGECAFWPKEWEGSKSLWFYFSSRQLLHSAASMSFCMTQRSLIPKGHKFWQLCFLLLLCFLLAVSVKTLDFYFDASEENQPFWRKTRRQVSTDNHCSFDFFLLFGRQQMPHPTVTLLPLTTNILQGFPFLLVQALQWSHHM